MGVKFSFLVFGVIIFGILIIIFTPSVLGAHFIIGKVENSYSGEIADGHKVMFWNPLNGIGDNITDTIGASGNSGLDQYYMIDCEMLSSPCQIRDSINVRVLDEGDGYTSEITSGTISGEGYDLFNDMRINSFPLINFVSPINYANVSTSYVNLSCEANDSDGNLVNMSLYGNWSGEWSMKSNIGISGNYFRNNFSVLGLNDGRYKWGCQARDSLNSLGYSIENLSFQIDTTIPNITAFWTNISQSCGLTDYVRVYCNVSDSLTGVKEAYLNIKKPQSSPVNYSMTFYEGITYFAEVPLNEDGIWNFTCNARDYSENIANYSTLFVGVGTASTPDFKIGFEDISFYPNSPIEREMVSVNLTVHNLGCLTSTNAINISLYDGNPLESGSPVGKNATLSFSFGELSKQINLSWSARIGITNLYAFADSYFEINELNETNNYANFSVEVTAWQDFYGNISVDKLIAHSYFSNLSVWYGENNFSGNVFVADQESSISWNSLQAVGRNFSGQATNNDFNEIDSLLNMNSFTDSISSKFTSNGINPRQEMSFSIYKKLISNVAVINITADSPFSTGILWDTTDDTNGEFDTIDKEDLVFATKTKDGNSGTYGIYDYELSVPVKLREYLGPDISDVYLYFEIN